MTPWRPEDWQEFLRAELRRPVRVVFGRSRTLPLQARPVGGGGTRADTLEVRLHGMFARAPEDVRAATVRWLRRGRGAPKAAARLDAWIDAALDAEPVPPRRRPRADPRGAHHDLEALAAPLFATTFAADFPPERPRPALTWGRRARSRSRRSLRLGSYDLDMDVVRVHPALDQPGVPAWFVRTVLMHEILHAAVPPRLVDGRREHHGRAFRERERADADYGRAREWEEHNLPALIRAARTGRPLRVPEGGPAPEQLELF
jgi:hypothetical protein